MQHCEGCGSTAAAQAASTRRAYTSAWTRFTTWCEARGAQALPAYPNGLIRYFTESAEHLVVGSLMVHQRR